MYTSALHTAEKPLFPTGDAVLALSEPPQNPLKHLPEDPENPVFARIPTEPPGTEEQHLRAFFENADADDREGLFLVDGTALSKTIRNPTPKFTQGDA